MSLQRPDGLITLYGETTSVVLEEVDGGAPLWRYWGPRLSDEFAAGPALRNTRPTPSFSLDETIAFSVFPTFGLGWFGQSALLAHRQGLDFAQGFTSADVVWITPGKTLKIAMSDDIAGICAEVLMSLEHDVLTLSTSLTNTGIAPLDIHWLAAASLLLPDTATEVHSFSGRHNGEFLPQCDALGRAIWRKENRKGLTSHDVFPGASVRADGAIYRAQFAWSGNHVQSIEWLDDGRYHWQFGEWLAPGEVSLLPGETMTSPDVLATCAASENGAAQNFHAAIRKRVTWPGGHMAPRPVHLNTWEGYYFDHDLPSLIALADVASAVGIERFVLDDGWFNGRNDDGRALGDWWADPHKYPNGLAPLARHIVAKGMTFGLWVEPEMVNPDSDLFRAHPEWAMQTAGRPLQTARNQLVLDLNQPGVCDYLFESIAKLLESLPITYLKWDHNRDLAAVGNLPTYRRQVIAAYALLARFRAAFPHVEIEACAGGGGRIDAGIAAHMQRFWTSDCIDAVSRARMQPGFLRYMPPELMGAHIGTAPAHSTGRSQSLDFRAAIACQGHFGVEFDLVKMPTDERDQLSAWIRFYKAWRHLLHAAVWTGAAGDGMIWHAAGHAEEWLLFVYRLDPMTHRHMPPVRLPFVDPSSHYEVMQTGPDGEGDGNIDRVRTVFDGSWLRQAGLPVPPMKAECVTIYHGKRR